MYREFFRRLPPDIWHKMHTTFQSPVHHAEGSVEAHSRMVADLLPQEVDFQMAALFHDMGKIDCTTFKESDKYGIIIQSVGHESISPTYIKRLKDLYLDYDVNWVRVEQMCFHHMRAHLYIDGKMSNKKKRQAFEELQYFNDIITFAKADSEGRLKENGLPILIILMGIPGSGKTTWRNDFVSKHPEYVVINPDEIRREVTGSISDQSKNNVVWKLAYERLEEAVNNRKNVIFDSTACRRKTIEEIIFVGTRKSIPCFKVLDIDLETAYSRIVKDIENKVDRSNVPYDVVVNMKKKFDDLLPKIENYGGIIK